MADSLGVWLPLRCKDYDLKLFHFSMVAWALWTNRNKMMIEKIFPTSPIDKWRILLREDDKGKLEVTRERLKMWVSNFVEFRRSRPPVDEFV
ncbi:hypothetical protein PVAP13_4KG309910 [Panicum virgatum]|uniref:Uncharacterized protein n=1 Tax=Panicum virgatum TaxID=38727 RepID=A0A8T0TS21_PANVG|nr:hypothetical protein PVAP13_4KG309910 [Panicum virgatum]